MGDVYSQDALLVRRTIAGDVAAFGDLVRKYEQRAFGVANGIVRDRAEAEDICQEAFLRAYRAIESYEANAQFFTWLYRIVVNLCLDRLRRMRNVTACEFDERLGPDTEHLDFDPTITSDRKEIAAQMQNALDQLSPIHRSALLLREVEGLSYKEISRAMGCSIGTVMSRLFHARKRMQEILRPFHEPKRLAA